MAELKTLKPFHGHPVTPGTDWDFTNPIDFESFNAKAFQELQDVDVNWDFSGPTTSSYQYIFPRTDEFAGPFDEVSRVITRFIDEAVGAFDPTDSKPAQDLELSGVQDIVTVNVIKNIDEFMGSLDQTLGLAPKPDLEAPGVLDEVTRVVRKSFHEFCGNADSEEYYSLQNLHTSTKVQVKVYEQVNSTVKVGVRSIYRADSATQISIGVNGLVGATATGGSNPFNSSVAIGGNTIIGPTAPVAAKTVYISIPNTGISTIAGWNDIMRFGLNLDYAGGNWNISTNNSVPVGALGQQVTILGLNGTITQGGNSSSDREYSSTQKGYVASGIFGTPKLNRQINLTLAGDIISAPVILNPSLLFANQNQWLTAKTIASLIGNICGVNVHWMVRDVPVKDFSLEPGMNGLSVLSSMAQRVGATLRWFGNNNYYVAYPNFTIGAFTVPNQNLIAQAGIASNNILDLETGLSGVGTTGATMPSQGIYTVPTSNTTSSQNGGTVNVPTVQGGTAPTATRIANVTKLLTSNDPPLIFDLPLDYDQVYIQILIPAGKSTGGANQLGIQNFVTTDPNQIYLFSDVGFANQYVFQTLVGNSYIPQVKVDSRLMPSNESVRANNFTLSLYCTRKSLGDAFDAAKQAAIDNSYENAYRNPTFVQTYRGTINCYFYGVLPLPGMRGSATVDDFTVSGTIENVSLSHPGDILTINVARYKQINYIQPIGNIDAQG